METFEKIQNVIARGARERSFGVIPSVTKSWTKKKKKDKMRRKMRNFESTREPERGKYSLKKK